MKYKIKLHPDTIKYLDKQQTPEKKKIIKTIKQLSTDPYNKRPTCDIKKLKGEKRSMYRLRIGNHRIEYFIEENTIWIIDAFKRSRGYR